MGDCCKDYQVEIASFSDESEYQEIDNTVGFLSVLVQKDILRLCWKAHKYLSRVEISYLPADP